ncbi:hypothetical protein PTSG_04831 [Salpingoeca rosetta]|uniref:Armadillo repeat-containing domain-containing protein n=1 Tax=Salpingoeca rosetta (strain ATCC 50818 / BSB-021) TaxID=946362 RepID=F2U9U0_SALR5|nr:uncharacterized protein PTSG_04831 [Salpingoeca rosetta]EGD73117.1 hypothetical protein PTSG_04831 [Salpingoeca rosetta]|eukprot:XP_004994148.1 hypothetical protein PTSG_04831 [Salpingoeca rosetta]
MCAQVQIQDRAATPVISIIYWSRQAIVPAGKLKAWLEMHDVASVRLPSSALFSKHHHGSSTTHEADIALLELIQMARAIIILDIHEPVGPDNNAASSRAGRAHMWNSHSTAAVLRSIITTKKPCIVVNLWTAMASPPGSNVAPSSSSSSIRLPAGLEAIATVHWHMGTAECSDRPPQKLILALMHVLGKDTSLVSHRSSRSPSLGHRSPRRTVSDPRGMRQRPRTLSPAAQSTGTLPRIHTRSEDTRFPHEHQGLRRSQHGHGDTHDANSAGNHNGKATPSYDCSARTAPPTAAKATGSEAVPLCPSAEQQATPHKHVHDWHVCRNQHSHQQHQQHQQHKQSWHEQYQPSSQDARSAKAAPERALHLQHHPRFIVTTAVSTVVPIAIASDHTTITGAIQQQQQQQQQPRFPECPSLASQLHDGMPIRTVLRAMAERSSDVHIQRRGCDLVLSATRRATAAHASFQSAINELAANHQQVAHGGGSAASDTSAHARAAVPLIGEHECGCDMQMQGPSSSCGYRELIDGGAIAALCTAMQAHPGDMAVQTHALEGMAALAAVGGARHSIVRRNGIELALSALSTHDSLDDDGGLVTAVAVFIEQLTCSSHVIRRHVATKGGVQALLGAFVRHQNNTCATAAVLRALFNLSFDAAARVRMLSMHLGDAVQSLLVRQRQAMRVSSTCRQLLRPAAVNLLRRLVLPCPLSLAFPLHHDKHKAEEEQGDH